MVLLDTDLMTLLERESAEAQRLRVRLATVPQDDLATTIISYEEQTRGWLSYMAQLTTTKDAGNILSAIKDTGGTVKNKGAK